LNFFLKKGKEDKSEEIWYSSQAGFFSGICYRLHLEKNYLFPGYVISELENSKNIFLISRLIIGYQWSLL